MSPKVADPVRAAETEAAILEAARDLAAEGGLDALSMRGVAAQVGLSATAIYHYFENKQALVTRVVTLGFERFVGYLRAAIAELPRGSRERLRALGDAYIRFALENREYFKVLFGTYSETPQDIEELPDGGGYDLFRQTVVEAMESGAIRRADPDLVVLYLWAHVHGLVTLLLACRPEARCRHSGERLSAPDLFARFRDFVYSGLRPQGAPEVETDGASAS
jgi:AcrR family transcriptional regulator